MDERTNAADTLDGGAKKRFEDSLILLGAVRSSLADLLKEVRDGKAGGLRDLAAKQSELETALRRVFETEHKFNEWYARQTGLEAPGEMDFDTVRHEIGCRLARLRACCGSD